MQIFILIMLIIGGGTYTAGVINSEKKDSRGLSLFITLMFVVAVMFQIINILN